MKVNKKLIAGIVVFSLITLGVASWTVITQVIKVTVPEPFTVYYGIAGEPEGYANCAAIEAADAWVEATGTEIDAGDFYPGEDRRICIKVENVAENSLPYSATVSAAPIFGIDNQCESKTVPGEGSDICYIDVEVTDDAEPKAYSPSISLLRG